MYRFERAFKGRKHVFIAAIHVSTWKEATETDIDTAHEEGVDGIIVIRDYKSHATDDDVLAAYDMARKAYPDWWIGINLLQHSAIKAAASIRLDTNGLWFDDSKIDESRGDASFLQRLQGLCDCTYGISETLLLPSIAFKYQQPEVRDIARVAKLAEPYADVLITSGEETGVAADLDKVRRMREAVSCPIGLASGVSVENVSEYISLGVNVFIVNTSISDGLGYLLEPEKVRALRHKIPA